MIPIDEAGPQSPRTSTGATWALVTDAVMGGVSSGALRVETVSDRPALRLTGEVRLENRGGFVQMAVDLDSNGRGLDASDCTGVELCVMGNGETYGLHLRTLDHRRPWESFRHSFIAGAQWQTLRLPFSDFHAHRCDGALDLRRLRRLGLVAIGRAFQADLALSRLAFY